MEISMNQLFYGYAVYDSPIIDIYEYCNHDNEYFNFIPEHSIGGQPITLLKAIETLKKDKEKKALIFVPVDCPYKELYIKLNDYLLKEVPQEQVIFENA